MFMALEVLCKRQQISFELQKQRKTMCEDSTSFEFLNVCVTDLSTIGEIGSKIRGGNPKHA
jgi:hypothetical protein